jgi:hypothetical protein
VEVLTECWRGALAGAERRRRRVDLNGVTFIDGEGNARLVQMYAQGAQFIADDPMTKAIVAEIAGQQEESTVSTSGGKSRQVNTSEQLKQLRDLEAQLHGVNQELVEVRPLDRMADLNLEERKQLGAKLRAVLARWESVTEQISQVLGNGSASAVSPQHTTKADRNDKQ